MLKQKLKNVKVNNMIKKEDKIKEKKEEIPIISSIEANEKQILPDISGFDMSKYIAKPYEMPIILKREIVTIPVKRPGDQVFFRIHPTEEVPVWLLKWHEDSEMYLINPDIISILAEQPKLYILYLGMMLNGNIFLYPIQQKDEGGKWNSWHQSSFAVVTLAKKKWVRAIAQRSINGYTPIIAESNHAEPEWPNKSLNEILSIAFRDKRIDTENHPIVKTLKGK